MGTSHSEQLNTLSKTIWEWAIARRLWLSAAHIPGKLNIRADLKFRSNRSETEWMLNTSSLFRALEQLKMVDDIDLFASRLNKQFPKFVSYSPDPEAYAVDAFALQWTNEQFYAFPPFSLIPMVLKMILHGRPGNRDNDFTRLAHTGLVHKAMTMTLQTPVHLFPSITLVVLPNQPETIYPLHGKLSLLVCHLPGAI